jgi:hypothetical protein
MVVMRVVIWGVVAGGEFCQSGVLERLRVMVVIRVGMVALCVVVHGRVVVTGGLQVTVVMSGGVVTLVLPGQPLVVVGGSRRVVVKIVGLVVGNHVLLEVHVTLLVDVSRVWSREGDGQWQKAS